MTKENNTKSNGGQTLLLESRSPIGKQFSTATAMTKLMPKPDISITISMFHTY